jgi:hypothetical protein
MNYSEFQNQTSSEKITLAIVNASKRLMGWSLHSGSVYKIENFDIQSIVSIEDSGTAYTEVASIGAVTASKFYNDRTNKILYLRTTGSDNPNGRFLSLNFRLFFSNSPIALPYDLNEGFEVFFEPLIQSTSQFGVEIDTIDQNSEALEGKGNLTLINDQDFWPANFDKLYFDNQSVRIYSYNRDLEPSEAKLIFRGKIEKKTYTSQKITFSLNDTLSELRSPISLGTIADLGARTGADLADARQRLVMGRVFGHRPVNIDQVLDGYPMEGTVSIDFDSVNLVGTDTEFLNELSPDDQIVLNGVNYTIATVTDDENATLTESYADSLGLTDSTAYLLPEKPKRWMNRVWHIAGHPLRQPVATVAAGSSILRLVVEDNVDIYPDDWISVGPVETGNLVQVESTVGDRIINLKTSLAFVPAIGSEIIRPCVQNVRINDIQLAFWDDYTVDPEEATITLRTTAESNAAPVRFLASNLTFTNTSRTVTGSGLKGIIQPGYMVGVAGNAVFFEVLSVDSDEQLTLRTPSTFSATASGRYKALIFNPESDVLTVDVLGKTEDGETNGVLLKTAPSMVRALLNDIGLTSQIDNASFDDADITAPMHLGIVAPESYNDTKAAIYRDVINKINISVFGSLIQTNDFELSYHVLSPDRSAVSLIMSEPDILSMSFESTAANLVKTTVVKYNKKEYDYLVKGNSYRYEQKTSDIANYIAKANREKTYETRLVKESDASKAASRWAFILENGAGKAVIKTKLQAMSLDVGSVIEVTHRKFFERFGLSSKSRLFLVESVKKSGTDVTLEVVDLSNAFSRVASINELSVEFSDASDAQKLYGGFYTDEFGLIDNDPESFGLNRIW